MGANFTADCLIDAGLRAITNTQTRMIKLFLNSLLANDNTTPFHALPVPFDASQLDIKLIGFLSSVGCQSGFGATGYTTTDDGTELSVTTRGIPIWFMMASMALPVSALIGFPIYQWIVNGRVDLRPLLGLFLVPLPFAAMMSLVRFLNRRAGDGKTRFVVHRADQSLTLCEDGVALRFRQIQRLILVKGWQTKKEKNESNATWAYELSCVAPDEGGELHRWHMITTSRSRIRNLAASIAESMDTPLEECRSSIQVQAP